MDSFMAFKITFVAGGVVAAWACVVLLPAVNRQMALQQCLTAKATPAEWTWVAVVVKDCDMLSERSFCWEADTATLELLVASLVHSGYMTLQVIASVSNVPAVWARKQFSSERVAHKHGQLHVISCQERGFQFSHFTCEVSLIYCLDLSHAEIFHLFRACENAWIRYQLRR